MTNYLIKKAFEELSEMELKHIEDCLEKDAPIMPTYSYLIKMKKLIENPYSEEYESPIVIKHRISLRYALIAVLLMIMFTTTVIAFTPVREKLKDIIITLFSDHVDIDSIEEVEPDEANFVIKIPHKIPEGYHLYKETKEDNTVHMQWIDNEDNTLDYFEQPSSELSITITSDSSEVRDITIGTKHGKMFTDKEHNITTVLYEEEGVTFILIGCRPEEEMIQIADTIY